MQLILTKLFHVAFLSFFHNSLFLNSPLSFTWVDKTCFSSVKMHILLARREKNCFTFLSLSRVQYSGSSAASQMSTLHLFIYNKKKERNECNIIKSKCQAINLLVKEYWQKSTALFAELLHQSSSFLAR